MLVICEDCGKKYNIDESRITRNRARFTCNECGHIIIVDKTDLARSLFSSVNPGTAQAAASSVDLVREMESSPVDSKENTENKSGDFPPKEEAQTIREKKKKKNNEGLSLLACFVVLLLFTLVSVTGVTGYLATNLFFSLKQQQAIQLQYEYLLQASLIFVGTWLIVLMVFALTGLSIKRKLQGLTNSASQLASGVYDIQISRKGPREIRCLAAALEALRQRLNSAR